MEMANQELKRREFDADDLGLNDVDYFRDFIRNPAKGGIAVNFFNKDKNFGKNSSPPPVSYATSNANVVPASASERENSNGDRTGWSTAGFSSLQSPKPSMSTNAFSSDFDGLRRPFRHEIPEKGNYDKSYQDRVKESDREYRKGISRRRDSREYGKDRRRMRSRSRSKSRSRSRSRDRYDSRRHQRSPHRMPRKPYSPLGNPYGKVGMMSGSAPRGPPDYFPDANMGYYNGPPPPTNPYQPPPGWGNTAPMWTPNVVEIQHVETPEEIARKKAVEKEASHLINDFLVQKKNYLKKRKIFSKELELLKQQRRELFNSDSIEMKKVMAENIRLQEELVGKIKYVDNGLEMLQGLITSHLPKGAILEEPKKSKKKQSDSSSDDSDSDSSDSEEDRKMVKKKNVLSLANFRWPKQGDGAGEGHGRGKSEGGRFNFSFYDTEIHWCRPCKAFPPTAKDYLNHLHSKDHKLMDEERTIDEIPWHDKKEHEEVVNIPGAETIRIATKGLQFFVGATAWYCRLCQSWMGDFHCASLHLKSKLHNDNYDKFIEKNPKWEVSWLSERGKALIACGKKEDVLKRQLEEQLLLQKKHEDEIRQSMEASNLVMPLTLQTQPKNAKAKKSKKGKKKKKRKTSNTSSSSSSSSSSDSSSEEDSKKKRKSKKKKRDKSKGRSSAAGPEKSKWEKEEEEYDFGAKRSPEPNHPILEAREIAKKVRSYKWTDDLVASQAPTPPLIPEKHTILIPESTASSTMSSSGNKTQGGMKDDIDEGELRFDLRAAAAVNKKKPLPPNTKTKFAFIGRMPFAKKRNDPSETTKAKKEQDVATPDPTPPPPPIISKTVIPPKVQQPEPPVLTSKTKVEVAKDILTKSQMDLVERQLAYEMRPVDPVSMEMDMDIEKPLSPPLPIEFTPPLPKYMPALPPEVTGNLGKRTMAVPLPKDFQDALSIIYPENVPPKAATPPPPPPPSMDGPQPPREESPPLPPPAPPITLRVNDESDGEGVPPPPSPPSSRQFSYDRSPPSPPEHFFSNMDDLDDMAMLGIDKEDMAAQPF